MVSPTGCFNMPHGSDAGGSIGSKYAEDKLTSEKSADLIKQMTQAASKVTTYNDILPVDR